MKTIGITYTSKASSILALTLLLLSGTVGLLAFAPAARAASNQPTISVSPNSGSPELYAGATLYGKLKAPTTITVTGTGFPSGQTGISIGLIATSVTVTPPEVLAYAQCLMNPSVAPAAGTCGTPTLTPVADELNNGYTTVTADANGDFTAQFQVPNVEGSPADYYNVAATYLVSSGYVLSNSVPFNVVPIAAVYSDVTGASSGTYNSQVDIAVAGFAPSEAIDVLPSTYFLTISPWANPTIAANDFSTFTVDATGSTISMTCAYPATVGTVAVESAADDCAFLTDRPGGTVTATFVGASSGNTATATFTAVPSLEFGLSTFASYNMKTALAITSSANTAYLEVHNFPKLTTLPSNSLTIGGVTTIQSSVETTSEGTLAVPLAFTYTSGLTPGPLSATFDGITFSWANGNIVATPSLQTFQEYEEVGPQGALIATTTSLSFVTMNSVSQGVGDYAYAFGVCNDAPVACAPAQPLTGETWGYYQTAETSNPIPMCYSITTDKTLSDIVNTEVAEDCSAPATWKTAAVAGEMQFDQSGTTAGYWLGIYVPNSFGGSSTTSLVYTLGADFGATTPTTTFSITPSYNLYGTTFAGVWPVTGIGVKNPSFDNSMTTVTLSITGWNSSDPSSANPTANLYLGSNFWFECTVSNGAWGFANAAPGATICTVPDDKIPDVGTAAYTIWVNGTQPGNYATESLTVLPTAEAVSLSSTLAVTPGTPVSLLTATGAGIHGLAANTVYTVTYSGTSTGVTFTTTAKGQVPPGVQFVVPAGTAGQHIVDVVSSTLVSEFYGNEVNTAGQYTNLIITTTNTLTATPSSGSAGGTVALTGAGLGPNLLYYVWVPLVITTPPAPPYASFTSFTSTATGGIPSGVSFTFPSEATSLVACAGAASPELGTSQSVYVAVKSGDIQNPAPSEPTGTASFFVEAQLALSVTTAPAGTLVSYTATGLCDDTGYSIIFNYQVTSLGTTFTGTIVGSFFVPTEANGGLGTATGTFTVPASASAGAYTIQVVRTDHSYALGVLSAAPTLTVSGPVTTGLTTSTVSPTGSATESLVSGQATISQPYTNSYTSPLSVYMWVDVMNSAGQTVGVFLGSATIPASGSASIGAALFNLPSGTYTATVFVTTTSGIVVSTTSTVSSFTVT